MVRYTAPRQHAIVEMMHIVLHIVLVHVQPKKVPATTFERIRGKTYRLYFFFVSIL